MIQLDFPGRFSPRRSEKGKSCFCLSPTIGGSDPARGPGMGWKNLRWSNGARCPRSQGSYQQKVLHRPNGYLAAQSSSFIDAWSFSWADPGILKNVNQAGWKKRCNAEMKIWLGCINFEEACFFSQMQSMWFFFAADHLTVKIFCNDLVTVAGSLSFDKKVFGRSFGDDRS